jgi:hypothetical protein
MDQLPLKFPVELTVDAAFDFEGGKLRMAAFK